jgi:hypothetical protein
VPAGAAVESETEYEPLLSLVVVPTTVPVPVLRTVISRAF